MTTQPATIKKRTMMKRTKFFLDFDKEEAWLNQMAAEGCLLIKKRLRYTFTPVEPGTAVVRVDYQPTKKQADFDDYVGLFAAAGWQHLSGKRQGGVQYFASLTEQADADIFSDHESKAQRYRRSLAAHGAVLAMFLVFAFTMWPLDLLSVAPREWYLTEGLWDMQGLEFAGAFALETIFVIFRVGVPATSFGIVAYCAGIIAYQSVLYRRANAARVA